MHEKPPYIPTNQPNQAKPSQTRPDLSSNKQVFRSYGGEDSSSDISRGKSPQPATTKQTIYLDMPKKTRACLRPPYLIYLHPGIFAGTVGVRRLLKLFAKYNITTTWYIPGHSLDTFPEECAMIRDAGHEMYVHV